MYGNDFEDTEIKDEVVLEVVRSCVVRIKKHGIREMSLNELRKICGV